MNKKEAKQIIQNELEQFRNKPYSELVQMINAEPIDYERIGPNDQKYGIEIQAFWDGKKDGDIRVIGAIDDGSRWRLFHPLTEDFIKTPDNEFIDE